jgi:hypothetical protein
VDCRDGEKWLDMNWYDGENRCGVYGVVLDSRNEMRWLGMPARRGVGWNGGEK